MAIPSDTFTEMVTTTLRNRASSVVDNVSNHNALLRRMKQRGNIKTLSGGYEIQRQIDYAQNGTYQRYAGYDQLDTAASDVLTSVKYEWRQLQITVTASGREIRQNRGKDAMIDLVNARVANATRTAGNEFSVDMYSDGALANQVNGLANLIQTNGQGTVGGINAGTYTFWRNQFKEMTGTDTAASPTVSNSEQMRGDMNDLWQSTVRGTDKPDIIVMTHDFYALYELSLQDRQRYTDAGAAADGFESLKYKGADVFFDDNTNFATNGERAYFINTEYLHLVQHRDAQWSTEERRTPVNQDAVIIPMFWMGNMVLTNRRLQGILFDAA